MSTESVTEYDRLKWPIGIHEYGALTMQPQPAIFEEHESAVIKPSGDSTMETRNGQIAIYQTDDGQTEIEIRVEQYTLGLTLSQMAELFDRDKSVISRHIRNALSEGEVVEKAICKKCILLVLTIRNLQMVAKMLAQTIAIRSSRPIVAGSATIAEMRCSLREVFI